MLDPVLGGVLEASWSDFETAFGSQKTFQDGAKMGQEGAKTLPRQLRIASKTPSKRAQMSLKTAKHAKKVEIPKNI